MYVQKKMLAKLEQERVANQQQQQLDALKRLASLQQINSAQHQQQQLTAFLAAMMNKNFILNQQQPTPQAQSQTNPPAPVMGVTTVNNTVNCTVNNQAKTSNHQISRKRSHSNLDAFSSSEEEPYCYAKMRQPPSLGKPNSSSSKVSISSKAKLDQNNNSVHSLFQETSVSTTSSPDPVAKQYDSGHSDDEELDSKNQSKRGRNYRKMMIEKRRRDRINNSLNELRRLVPAAFEKQGSAKLEKAEILQRTVIYLKSLHAKGFDKCSFEPAKFALDYHTIGFTECVNETARYLTNNEEIDDRLKERVIAHLKAQLKNELTLKDEMMTSIPLNGNKTINNDHQQTVENLSTGTNKMKKIHRTSSPSKLQQIKMEPKQAHNNLLNLHSSIPSPPSSSVSPSSTLSSSSRCSSNPVTASESDSSQIYSHLPYTLLKNKILSYNSPVQSTKQSPAILTNHHNLNSLKCL